MKNLVNFLINSPPDEEGSRMISENEIIIKYSQLLGITPGKFRKQYLPILRKLRRKEPNLQILGKKDEKGQNKMYWMLNN